MAARKGAPARGRTSKAKTSARTSTPSMSTNSQGSSASTSTSGSSAVELPLRTSPRLVQTKINAQIIGRNHAFGKRPAKLAKRSNSKRSSTSSVEEITAEEPEPQTQKKAKVTVGRSKEDMIKELIAFDLDSAFGPSRGISRYERLERAVEYGLCLDQAKIDRLRENLEALLEMEVAGKDGVKAQEAEQCMWDHPTMYASYRATDKDKD